MEENKHKVNEQHLEDVAGGVDRGGMQRCKKVAKIGGKKIYL